MLPELASLIHAQRERTSALERERGVLIPFVFHRNGRPILSFHQAWRAACERARVPDRLVHDLRRTAARNLVRSGVPERTAMALLGHKTRSIVDRYNIVNEADLAEGVRRLAAFPAKAKETADGSARSSSRIAEPGVGRARIDNGHSRV